MTTNTTPNPGTLTEEEREALRLTEEDQVSAHEAMQDGEWQWFGWLYLRKFERILASRAAAAPEHDRLRERLFVALTEQRVIDSWKYGEAPYAPVTWGDVDAALSAAPARTEDTGRDRETVERVRALADEWEADYPSPLAACNRTADEWWHDLRAALDGAES